jgi:hypothetical protein
MFEIIALIFLSRKNGTLAVKKGLAPGTWIWLTVLAWVVAEFIGVVVGVALYGKTALVSVMLTGLMCGFGGYLLIRKIIENKPDPAEQDLNNRVRIEDLKPPKK